ncbi:MAG: hypothetical protein AAF413_04595 [Patescibacteria group bacterium]
MRRTKNQLATAGNTTRNPIWIRAAGLLLSGLFTIGCATQAQATAESQPVASMDQTNPNPTTGVVERALEERGYISEDAINAGRLGLSLACGGLSNIGVNGQGLVDGFLGTDGAQDDEARDRYERLLRDSETPAEELSAPFSIGFRIPNQDPAVCPEDTDSAHGLPSDRPLSSRA